MKGGCLNAGRALLLIAALTALLAAAGCGSSNGVTVQTGSLSKAAFIKKADAICQAARTKLIAKFFDFLKTHKALASREDVHAQRVVATETVNLILVPNVEGEIKQISELGAPEDYASEVEMFLNTLQERLDKVHENPAAASATASPFKRAGDTAKQVGMIGCAESFGSRGPA